MKSLDKWHVLATVWAATRNLPITIRSPFGGGVHTPELHSDNLEGLIAQSPGIRVVIPSNPYDAKGLLIASIRSNDPVVFLEHMKLYRSFREEVPEEAYEVPLDKAAVTREGTDVSIITYGAMVREAIKAADNLAKKTSMLKLSICVQLLLLMWKQSLNLLKKQVVWLLFKKLKNKQA